MTEVYLLSACIFLLALVLLFLPLRLTWKGKGMVWISGAGLGFLTFISMPMFPYWAIFPTLLLLAALLSYLIMKNVEIFKDSQDKKRDLDKRTEPLFSYAELKEKAKYAETIDHYYVDAAKLVNAGEAQVTADEREEGFSYPLGQTEIDQLLQHHLSETAVSEESGVEEMVSDQPKTDGSHQDLSATDSMESVSPVGTSLEEQWIAQEPEDHSEVKLPDFGIPPVSEAPSGLRTADISESNNLLEEIDFSQRAIAAGRFEEKAAESSVDLEVPGDDANLVEVRKRLFASIDEDAVTNGNHELLKPGFEQRVSEAEQREDEAEQNADQDAQVGWDDLKTAYDDRQIKPDEAQNAKSIGQTKWAATQTAVINRFSSPQLEAAFDDLEELYLKKKASEQKEEGHE